jgi:iron complex outermembrane receptor protein
LGQQWAEGASLSKNIGGVIAAQLDQHWSVSAGLFHSLADNPVSFSDLYQNTNRDGLGEHIVIGYPDQMVASTSGEARLTGHFLTGFWSQEILFDARGRDAIARYGGSDAIDVGPALIGAGLQVPEPQFIYSSRTADRSRLWSVGAAYRGRWKGIWDFAVGLQKERYEKMVTLPGMSPSRLSDQPLRAYGNASMTLTDRLTLYVGATQGLEDSGVAPGEAQNRGTILPASRTWQMDSGLRLMVTPHLKLIAGVFEIQKPYFNLDANAIDRNLGQQAAKGVELSVSGEVIKDLNVTAAALWNDVRIKGADLRSEGIGPLAFGQPRLQYVINTDYVIPKAQAFSADLSVIYLGTAPASIDGVTISPAVINVTLGSRYRFEVLQKRITLRVEIQNVSNFRAWATAYTPGWYQLPAPRTVFAYLTADI